MFILITIIYGIIIGSLAGLMKKRFPIWFYIFTALLGALVGAGLSFGDSALFIQYPFLNIWTVPLIFSVLFSLVTLFADKGKTVQTVVSIFIIIAVIVGLIYVDSSPNDYSSLFREEITRAGVERVGQPIEGFSAFMYLEAFPGFEESDFDGVKSLEGRYKLDNGKLQYERTENEPATSAEDVISEEGYATLLENFSTRVGITVKEETDINSLLEKLREGDEVKVSYVADDFSIWLPEGWYVHELENSVLFTRDETLETPQNTESYALGPQFQIVMQTISLDELLEQNLWNEGSEFLVSKEGARIGSDEVTKVVAKAAGAGGETLHYIFEATDERIFTLSHYPYERGSNDTNDFEQAAQTFMINYVYQGEDGNVFDSRDGTTGILPFESGATGVVLLGPTCPVQKDPPDPNCADKGYATTVQVIEKNSPKSSLFSSVETDKEGNYTVMLPPGEYQLQALGGQPFPRCEWQDITIEPDAMVNVDLLCDTGIR